MRVFCCLVAACAAFVSCHRKANSPAAESPASLKTNAVSKLNDKARPIETLVYETNGLLKQRTFYLRDADGRILTARTVDPDGKSKWTDQYSYGEPSNQRPVEIRRMKADGQIISMRFLSLTNGTERR